jgi:adenosylhomocysteine nucleosidase
MMTRTIGLVVALNAEASALIGRGRWQQGKGCPFRQSPLTETDSARLMVARSGLGPENAEAASRWLIGEGVGALGVSGVSGGLAPELGPGDLILADAVIQAEGDRFRQVWEEGARFAETAYGALTEQGVPVYRGPIITVRKPVLSRSHKASLFTESKALAVDMESAAVASVARTAGRPFFALRAVCDPADRPISEDLFRCIDQKGDLRLFHLLRMVLRHPAMISELLNIKRDFGTALANLRGAWNAPMREILPSLL